MPFMQDARCLDLFAGSGAFGFEALSRGARHVVLCDTDSEVVNALMHNAKTLQVDYNDNFSYQEGGVIPETDDVPLFIFKGDFIKATAAEKTPTSVPPFDIVFVDPPFSAEATLIDSVNWLGSTPFITENTLIYMESNKDMMRHIPASWECYRYKETARIGYGLYRRG